MLSKGLFRTICIIAATLLLSSLPFAAQTSKRRTGAKPASVQAQPSPTPESVPAVAAPSKKNGRPSAGEQTPQPAVIQASESTTIYTYEFSQPDFVVSSISIKHDENGKGTIAFKKRGLDDPEKESISLSPKTLTRINESIAALNFLDSAADYQYVKDYSHLGNVTFTFTRDGKTRSTKFNWTENKDARAIADEYRRIANQYVWQFDITVARENQPLDAPQLLDSLDNYIRRGEISDPSQMVQLLKGLSNDERIPLIARNHAAKLVTQINKDKK
jgi:hypothetical protein